MPLKLFHIYLFTLILHSNGSVDSAGNDEDLLVRRRHIEPLPALRLGGVHHVCLTAPHAAPGAPHDRMLKVEAVRLDDAVADGHSAGVARLQVAQAPVEQSVACTLHSEERFEIT